MSPQNQSAKSLRVNALRVAGALLGLTLLWLTFRDVDMARVLALVSDAGPLLFIAWGAFLLANALDVEAFRVNLRLLGRPVPFLAAARAHVSSEAAMMSLPLGVVVAEPLRAFLLKRSAELPVSAGVTATAARKYLLMAGETVVVALGALFGAEALTRVSMETTGTPHLRWVPWGIAALLLLLTTGYALLLGRGGVAERVLSLAERVGPTRAKPALDRARAGFVETDATLGRFFRLPRRSKATPFFYYVALWLLESFEAYIVLRVLGAPVTFETVLCMESFLSFVRSTVALLPAGLGVQDMGYALFLGSLGVPNALDVAAAFSLLKRSKEAMWVTAGYGLLVLGSGSKRLAAEAGA